MFPRGARVLVALSGGADSVALLHILRELEHTGELALAGVAHVNHQLRGREADEDEAFCSAMAADVGLPFAAGRVDVAGLAQGTGRSIEDAARELRYAFFATAADELAADAIAVGHSADDQAETFLLRLMRGAGTRGLAGIRPRVGRVVRPLLELSRDEIRAYVSGRGLPFREDSTNRDVAIPRNRVRHELMPLLQQYAPALPAVLARQAAIARADEEYLEAQAIDLAATIVLRTECGIEIDAAALRTLPPALAARVARQALGATAAGRFIGFQHIERVLDLASDGKEGETVALPGQQATRRGQRVLLSKPGGEPFSNFFRFSLSIPGEVACPGWTISAEKLETPVEVSSRPARGDEVVVAAGPLLAPLAVRSRQRGDRFRPLGMGGRGRKLQDFLVDRKVARSERDRLPLVVDRDDRIVWVVGQSVAEDFRVTEPLQGVILLKARRLGGVG
jgi:tRNA(Ile)-lysidine synthase